MPIRLSRTYERLSRELQEASNEEKVRVSIFAALGIGARVEFLGKTDGVWEGRLFEFKHNKRFSSSGIWTRAAYGALSQALFYCKQIMNARIQSIKTVPKLIVIADLNGGFIVPTNDVVKFLYTDSAVPAVSTNSVDALELVSGESIASRSAGALTIDWDDAPSRQSEVLVNLLSAENVLEKTLYFDFRDQEQLRQFLSAVTQNDADIPIIEVSVDNFTHIFERWFQTFCSGVNEPRRGWVERFIADLRKSCTFDRSTGTVSFGAESWNVPVDVYESFWKVYKRPPTKIVDEYISTNKDILYDEEDRNDHGDFYTPLRAVKLAHSYMNRHIRRDKSRRLWWDPAAGGGNLFVGFERSDSYILSTKFEQDCHVLRDNSTFRARMILQLDFIHDIVEQDLYLIDIWEQIQAQIDSVDEVVFFMNPPFDDQAESHGSNQSLRRDFILAEDRDSVGPRALRNLHTRFLYRILRMTRTIRKPVWVAAFSSLGWMVGPDSAGFFRRWRQFFELKDGFLLSSKIFPTVPGEWPVLFSVWKTKPPLQEVGDETFSEPIKLDVYDRFYSWVGVKEIVPYSDRRKRLSEIPSQTIRRKESRATELRRVVPVQNEYEVARVVYDDRLSVGAIGYLRKVANDVSNSAQRVNFFSSMYGPSNSNGVAIMPDNFESALSVYGIRKSVRSTWLNNKDEFYVHSTPTEEEKSLFQVAILYALIDGGCSASLRGLNYSYLDENGRSVRLTNQSFRNEFFILTSSEANSAGLEDILEKDSFASVHLQKRQLSLSDVESNALSTARALIMRTFENSVRSKGDPRRQLSRVDAGMRQLINGLFEFKGANLSRNLLDAYQNYLDAKEQLRAFIEAEVYRLGIIRPFIDAEDLISSAIGAERN